MARKKKKSQKHRRKAKIVAIDLFCGVGGLTKGLSDAGIGVKIGVDIDPDCRYPYTANNASEFLLKSVADVTADDLSKARSKGALLLLAGCAPCQPFSTYRQKDGAADERWNLLDHFSRLVKELDPEFVTMENVPNLQKQEIFETFTESLKSLGYFVFHEVVDCSEYGVPQQRRRLVLLASKLGPIALSDVREDKAPRTVKDAIGSLSRLKAGNISRKDPLHQSCGLSELNLRRIRSSRPGGTWRDWEKGLVASCHKKKTGKTYPSVYGRMEWDRPAPTITTQYYAFGSGRFGHPSQDRAISLREGAILQSFPRNYKFVQKGRPIFRKTIGRLIGNAVPVKLGEAIGRSILEHVRACSDIARKVA